MFDLCWTLPKYLRTFLHENAFLTNWSNGPIRLQYMPLYGQTFHQHSIKYMRYKLNEQQYFDIETDTETYTRRVVELWTQDSPPPIGYEVFNIGLPVRCRNPLWEGSTIGTAAAASWAVILPAGNNEAKSPAGLCSLSTPWIGFVGRTLELTEKGDRSVVDPWTRDAPPPDGKVWFRRRRWAQKGLLEIKIRCGGGGQMYGR